MRRDLRFLIPLCTTGVRDPLYDHNDNRRYAVAPLSGELCLQAFRIVRNLFAFLFLPAQCGRCYLGHMGTSK